MLRIGLPQKHKKRFKNFFTAHFLPVPAAPAFIIGDLGALSFFELLRFPARTFKTFIKRDVGTLPFGELPAAILVPVPALFKGDLTARAGTRPLQVLPGRHVTIGNKIDTGIRRSAS